MGLKIFPASPLALKPIEDVVSMNYFRFTAMDKPGVLSNIAGILGRNNISIASVIQKGRREGGAVPVVILTHSAREKDVRRALARIDELPAVAAKTHRIRVEGRPGEGENA
jgi:homoserine dehydrogenase